jgi:transposase
MVLNGLGFVGRALYLTPEFFRTKPVDRLIGEGISAEQLNTHSLSRALDRLFERGVTEVFVGVASHALEQVGIRPKTIHLDSTSFALHGEYEVDPDDEAEAIEVRHGYSRDHRPDLKQVVLSLICAHEGAIPTWLQALSGNSADSGSFPSTVRAYLDAFQADTRD